MMNKLYLTLGAAGFVSMLAFANPSVADANARNRTKKLDQTAHRELRKDHAELQRDRADLSRLYRSGASRSDIDRKRAEIRDDLREIGQDRRSLSSDYGDYRYDPYRNGNGYGNYGWYGNRGRWDQNDNGWWNWGNNRRDNWNRRVWDYRHD
jgi:hypothetical protein